MKHRKFEIIMSVVMIVAIYITMRFGLPAVDGAAKVNNKAVEDKKIVVIDSGHGGIDSGKVSAAGILEKEINLSIAYKLKDILEANGIEVVMTRTEDAGLYQESDSNKKAADMKKRCEIIEKSRADIAVSIHQNSFSDPKVNGAQMFYYTHSKEGKELARALQESFKTIVNNNNTRIEKANNTYYMLVHTKAPTVIAECGFLSNWEEAQLLNTQEYQNCIAEAIYQGINAYFTK